MQRKIVFLFFMLLTSIGLQGVFAQTPGTISGIISDGETGETLISAHLYVEDTDKVALTDFDGKYSIELEPGTYSVRITYIGYTDKVVTDVEVKDGEVTYLDVAMGTSTQQLQEVVVTAQAVQRSENAILLLRKKSDKIQDGLSSQEMRRFAVGNVAAAMTKVTGTTVDEGKYVYIRGLGDRYSLSQLNGLILPSIDPYRNSAQLDLIPTNLLDNVVASKTFTPDQPGTFTGGNLDVKTKSFPEKETFSIGFSIGYNPNNNGIDNFLTYDGGGSDWLGYGLGNRARPSIFADSSFINIMNKSGELMARFGDEEVAQMIDQSARSVDYAFDPIPTSTPVDHGISLSYGNSFSTGENSSIGLILSGGYKRSYAHRDEAVKARWFLFDINAGALKNSGDYRSTLSVENPVVNGLAGLAYKINNKNSVEFNVLYNHNADKSTEFIIGEDGQNIEAPRFKKGRAQLFKEREMFNYQLSGKHVLNSLNEMKIEWKGSLVSATMDEPKLRFFSSQIDTEKDIEGIPLSNVNDPFYFWRELQDDIKTGTVDITLPFELGERKGSSFKFGGFYSKKDRNFDEYRYIVFTPPNADRFDGDFTSFFDDGNIGIRDVEDVGGNQRFIIGNYLLDQTQLANSYTGFEEVVAAYGMATIAVTDQLKAVVGGRFESTDIFVESKQFQDPDSVRMGSINKDNFLPSLNLIYALRENMNLRASYTQTIARPNLREIAPFVSFDPLIDEFFIGNPSLTTTDIQNYDLRWEWFYAPGELFAISGFYKNFDNPITLQYRKSSNPEIQFVNVDHGEIYGLEFEIRKKLNFISPALEKFKISSNFAIIESSSDVVDLTGLEPESRPFEGQAPFIANVSLNYSDFESTWDLTLAYNYVGDRLSLIGREGTPDIFDRARNTIDFVASKTFADQYAITVSAKNLLNEDFVTSSTFGQRDFIYSQFKKGRSFGISLNYKLL